MLAAARGNRATRGDHSDQLALTGQKFFFSPLVCTKVTRKIFFSFLAPCCAWRKPISGLALARCFVMYQMYLGVLYYQFTWSR